MFTIQRNHNSIRDPWLAKSCKIYLFFFDWATLAIDNELVITEIICISTNILIYLNMIVEIMFYFKFKFIKILSRMISKFYTNSLLRTDDWGNCKYWVVISNIK